MYLESGGCVKERALRVLSGITKKDHLFLSEVGETGEKTAAEGVSLSDCNTIWRLGWQRRQTLGGARNGTP